MTRPRGIPWRIVLPVKGAPDGKSRLDVPGRRELARAFACDTLDAVVAAVAASRVVVITPDPELENYAGHLGAAALADPRAGLNSAVAEAIRWARAADGPGPVAALLGDLPALRPEDLRVALGAATSAEEPLAFVPDRAGSGTVLLTAVEGDLVPKFGAGSARRHEDAGHARLDLDLPRLRTDVDVRGDLEVAIALGCGRHTSAVLARWAPLQGHGAAMDGHGPGLG